MLILQNLSFQAAKKSFLNSTQKFIKISINNTIVSSKQPAITKSSTLLEWKEPISLPLFLNAEYNFQLYEKHSFGYNPEQLNIIEGKIIIGEHDTYNNWEALTDKKQKYGFLSANIRKKLRYSPTISTAPPQNQILVISSIIAHFSTLKQKRAFIQIKLLNKVYKTQIAKSKSGELLFTDALEIQKTDQIYECQVQAFSFDAKQEKSELIGSGFLKFSSQNPQKRVVIKDNKDASVGQVFIDYKISPKDIYKTSKQLSKIVQRGTLIAKSIDSDRLGNNSNYMTKSIHSYNNNDSILTRSRKQSDKKVSVVNQNSNIFMPTEKRFIDYIDKQNKNISYLKQQRRDFDFREKHSSVYYKGASIGRGQKSDFTNQFRQNPGVGVYNLPSIWDRY